MLILTSLQESRLTTVDDLKFELFRCTRRIARQFEMLPSSLYLWGLMKEGSHPKSGGGQAVCASHSHKLAAVSLFCCRISGKDKQQVETPYVSRFFDFSPLTPQGRSYSRYLCFSIHHRFKYAHFDLGILSRGTGVEPAEPSQYSSLSGYKYGPFPIKLLLGFTMVQQWKCYELLEYASWSQQDANCGY